MSCSPVANPPDVITRPICNTHAPWHTHVHLHTRQKDRKKERQREEETDRQRVSHRQRGTHWDTHQKIENQAWYPQLWSCNEGVSLGRLRVALRSGIHESLDIDSKEEEYYSFNQCRIQWEVMSMDELYWCATIDIYNESPDSKTRPFFITNSKCVCVWHCVCVRAHMCVCACFGCVHVHAQCACMNKNLRNMILNICTERHLNDIWRA